MPREDGYKNLIPMDKRTPEDVKAISLKGGLANKERLEKQKTLNDIAKAVLNITVSKDKARSILGNDIADLLDSFDMGTIITVKQMLEAQEGSSKAYEVLRDTAGYKPTEKTEVSATITEADRSLLDKVAKRTGIDTVSQ